MRKAAWLIIGFVLAAGAEERRNYEPTRVSLAARPTPAWFNEAKFGIFIVWGPYSVPGWGPKGKYAEWYWYRIEEARKKGATDDPWLQFHTRVYGQDFPYERFVESFRAEMFDADRWAELVQRSGARYVVHTAKYHDGFCLWPSAEASRSWGRPWNSVETGPRRDLVGELDAALRRRGIKSGLYYSIYEWFNPLYLLDYRRYRDEHHFPQFKDMVTRYKPDLVWLDGQWEHSFDEWRSGELAAWLYNESPVRDFIAVNERWGGRRAIDSQAAKEPVVGYLTSEYEGGFDSASGAWEESRGMGASYGYNRNEEVDDYRTGTQLIRLLVEVAAKGGNLLLDIGPTGDGRIPVIMQQRLLDIGRWLDVCGEAIYGSTAGPVQPPGFRELIGAAAANQALTPAEEGRRGRARSWATTAKPGRVFVHLFDWPESGKLELPALAGRIERAWLMEGRHPVGFLQGARGVRLNLPACRPGIMPAVVALQLR